VDRRVPQAGKLELRIKLSALAVVSAERLPVGRLEIGANRGAARLVVDAHEARGLAIADRRRERGEVQELRQHPLVRRLSGAKMSHVPAPS
jgi:hypothetical protein